MAIGIGISPFLGIKSSAVSLGTTIATTHYNRVIADGGVLPAGISGLGSVLDSVISAYSITGSSDFNTKVPVFLDPHYTGYKLGAGSGTTLGQAARTVYAISSSADVTQTTAASQPLLLAHSGVNYWWGSGVGGNYCSTPNAAANQITGSQYEIIAKLSFIATGNLSVVAKGDYNGANYMLEIRAGFPTFVFTTASSGTASIQAPTSLGTFDGYIKVTKNVGTYTIYSSTDGVNYTSLVSTNSGTVPVSYNVNLQIGQVEGLSRNYVGKIYRATISNSIGGTPVVDFNPATYNAATSQTAWTSATGEVWTINTGTATNGYKGVLIDRTILQGDGIDDELNSGTITSRQYFSQYIALNPLKIVPSGGEYYVDGGGAKGLIYGNAGNINAYNGAEISFSSVQDNILKILNANFNNTSSTCYTNNSGLVSGSTGTNTTSKVSLFSNGSSGSFSNSILNSVLSSLTIDTSTQRTAIYNVVKTMNSL